MIVCIFDGIESFACSPLISHLQKAGFLMTSRLTLYQTVLILQAASYQTRDKQCHEKSLCFAICKQQRRRSAEHTCRLISASVVHYLISLVPVSKLSRLSQSLKLNRLVTWSETQKKLFSDCGSLFDILFMHLYTKVVINHQTFFRVNDIF